MTKINIIILVVYLTVSESIPEKRQVNDEGSGKTLKEKVVELIKKLLEDVSNLDENCRGR